MGKVGRAVLLAALVVATGCANQKAETRSSTPAVANAANAQKGRRYVDPDLGFEITRPTGAWALDASDDQSAEGVTIPVIMRHRDSGAQVVVQVAPAVASPTQFAERITEGLKSHPGFTTSDPQPLSYSDNAVGFNFAMEGRVSGRVAVLQGKNNRVYMMLATWPTASPDSVPSSVEQIFQSLRVL